MGIVKMRITFHAAAVMAALASQAVMSVSIDSVNSVFNNAAIFEGACSGGDEFAETGLAQIGADLQSVSEFLASDMLDFDEDLDLAQTDIEGRIKRGGKRGKAKKRSRSRSRSKSRGDKRSKRRSKRSKSGSGSDSGSDSDRKRASKKGKKHQGCGAKMEKVGKLVGKMKGLLRDLDDEV